MGTVQTTEMADALSSVSTRLRALKALRRPIFSHCFSLSTGNAEKNIIWALFRGWLLLLFVYNIDSDADQEQGSYGSQPEGLLSFAQEQG